MLRPIIIALSLLLWWGVACGTTEPPPDEQVADAAPVTPDTEREGLLEPVAPDARPEPLLPESSKEPAPEPPPEPTQPDQRAHFAQALKAFTDKYKIPLSFQERFPIQTTHGAIDGKDATDADIKRYAALFFPEWQLYPASLIQKTKLTKIVFCANLSFAGQPRTAIPDLENNVLYLDVARSPSNDDYNRRTIHHEFFHIIDWYDDRKLYSDPDWEKLNPQGFQYGTGGQNAQCDPFGSLLTDKYPGFFTSYSRSGVEEDKAEVFSILIVFAQAATQRSQTDAIIAAKIQKMKQLLLRFCPDLNDAFWTRAAALPRGN